jgi:hypothetical protein
VVIIKFILLQDQELLQCTSAGNPAGSTTVDYMVAGGGGGGGTNKKYFRWRWQLEDLEKDSGLNASGCYTASPLSLCFSFTSNSNRLSNRTVGAGGNGIAQGAPMCVVEVANQVQIQFFQQLHQQVVVAVDGSEGHNTKIKQASPGGSGGGGAGGGPLLVVDLLEDQEIPLLLVHLKVILVVIRVEVVPSPDQQLVVVVEQLQLDKRCLVLIFQLAGGAGATTSI